MAPPLGKLLGGWLCGVGSDPPTAQLRPPSPPEAQSRARRLSGATAPERQPSPHPALPALTFSPPLSAAELEHDAATKQPEPPAVDAAREPQPASPALPPPVAALPTLTRLRQVESPTIVQTITPPTPIDPPSSGSTGPNHSLFAPTPTTTTTSDQTPTRSSTPPSSRASLDVTHADRSPHLLPVAPSPTLTVSDRRSRSPGRPAGPGPWGHHRRSSSTGTVGSRSFRETINAYAVEGADGQRSVNQYILGETLGRGSYATVEKARDRNTGEEFAIKEFSKRRLRQIAMSEAERRERLAQRAGGRGRGRGRGAPRGRSRGGAFAASRSSPEELDALGPDNLELVKTEVAIMKKVDHPNVASIHEVIDVTSDDALLIMELCHGGPILKLKEDEEAEPYSEDKARDIFRQLVLGIAYLHHNQIIHRDIKPDNALFSDTLRTHVKLVDFGVSKFNASPVPGADDSVAGVAGTPAYMAPELLPQKGSEQGRDGSKTPTDPNAGYACDVWSLGVTLYALVVGRLPFQASDPMELFRQIREDDPSIPEHLSPELRSLISSLLDKSPAARPSIPSLWDNPWLTSSGQSPLPSYDDNVWSEIADPSTDEVDHALAAFRGSTFLAMSAAAKFKSLLTKRRSSPTPTTPRAESEPDDRDGVMVDSPDLVSSPSSSAFSPSPPNMSPVASPEPSPAPGASRRTLPPRHSNGRPPTRKQTTMSSLSLGEAVSQWGLASPTASLSSVDGADGRACLERVRTSLERACGDDGRAEQEGEEEGGEPRRRSASPTPRTESPRPRSGGSDALLHAGVTHPGASMDAAGVVKSRGVSGRIELDDGGEWEDPE
ncbi:uncharacterized protein JCM10292_002497 [Rhodotorula paludigena]|uniref:uncharacterized protein n=1 Tax=Rhodotorula paludigena TaxID=86838 RepID=UPI0031748B45